jgi:hypothetical protein
VAKLQAADFAYLVSVQFPRAPLENLETVIRWFIWIFMADDVVDETCGDFSNELAAGQKWRDEHFHFFHYHFGLGDEGDTPPVPSNNFVASAKKIADHVRRQCTKGLCEATFLEAAGC